MIRKGIKFKINRALSYRAPWPGEKDTHDRQIDQQYVVIVRLKDCPVVPDELLTWGQLEKKERGIATHDQTRGPMFFTHSHSRTNMVYGPRKKCNKYSMKSYTPVYWVENRRVYQGRIYHEEAE